MTTLTHPVRGNERVQTLDIIRGFALFGILMMNIEYFQKPLMAMMLGIDTSLSGLDFGVALFVFTFIQGKFYTMFSLLFGMGFVIFLDRAMQKVEHPKRLFFKRLFVLSLFGAAHLFFIWGGDILLSYAICGVFLLLFAKTKPSRLWKWGVFFIILPILLAWLLAFGIQAAMSDPAQAAELAAEFEANEASMRADIVKGAAIYATGSFWEIVQWRAYEASFIYLGGGLIFFLPTLLGTFLIGASFARAGIFTSASEHFSAYRRMAILGLVIGIPTAIYFGLFARNMNMMMPTVFGAQMMTIQTIANLALCLAYMSIIALVVRRAEGRNQKHWLHNLAPAGRMALTNYLTHSIVFTTVFYGYAFGMYGEIGRAAATGFAILLYLAQIPFSRWWIERFHFGPAEWLWRTLTYGKRQPFKRSA
ncbi:DUF418 domain-containing protein [Pseudidiomarina aestuarii]|uniref:DUF418 domain-containing protein n=1 Tax=Pseudidiomarina aestuarii TaxID=624146 RepID=UPI003A983ADD